MRLYEKSLFLRLAFTLAVIFVSIIVMVAWWQMLFHRNLDFYVVSEKEQLRAEILKGVYQNKKELGTLEKDGKVQKTNVCSLEPCIESGKGIFYQIHPDYANHLIEEKNRKFRMFLSETSFLIIIIIVTIGYMFWVISREKKIQLERQEFLTMTTHELKHPVSVISLLLESLARQTLPRERIPEFLERGIEEVKTLKKSLHNILHLQQINFSENRLHKTIDLDRFMEGIFQNWQLHDLNRKKRIVLEKPAERNITLTCNESDIQTILNNLIENALLYSQKKVTLRYGIDHHGAYIEVQDTGLGFSEEDRKNYQKMFFRSRRHDIQNIRGSGLGHFIIGKLLLKNSLQLTLESKGENKGSTFRINPK